MVGKRPLLPAVDVLAEKSGRGLGIRGFEGIDNAIMIGGGGFGVVEACSSDVFAEVSDEQGLERGPKGLPSGIQPGLRGGKAEQSVKFDIESG